MIQTVDLSGGHEFVFDPLTHFASIRSKNSMVTWVVFTDQDLVKLANAIIGAKEIYSPSKEENLIVVYRDNFMDYNRVGVGKDLEECKKLVKKNILEDGPAENDGGAYLVIKELYEIGLEQTVTVKEL